MKTIEINGQKVLAVNVPMDAIDVYVDKNTLEWVYPHSDSPEWYYLPHHNYTVLADSSEPEKFVKVFYPDAKAENFFYSGWVILVNGDAIIADCATDSFAWLLASCKIMQEHGLEGRIVLLTEKQPNKMDNNTEKQPLASEMTLLDYFAGLILCGTLSDPDAVGIAKSFANNSYVIAAAMIEERKKYIKP